MEISILAKDRFLIAFILDLLHDLLEVFRGLKLSQQIKLESFSCILKHSISVNLAFPLYVNFKGRSIACKKFPADSIDVIWVELEPSPIQLSGSSLLNFDFLLLNIWSQLLNKGKRDLRIEEDNQDVRVIDPSDFAYEILGCLDRLRKHLSHLPKVHVVHTVQDKRYAKRLGFRGGIVRFQLGSKIIIKNVDLELFIKILDELSLEILLFDSDLPRKFGHNDGEDNFSAIFAEHCFFDELLITGLLEYFIVLNLLFLLVEHIDRVLLGSDERKDSGLTGWLHHWLSSNR